ncbi:hypothetical protein FORC54_3033 [Vibrio vulnificus]|nr:hypothetical protein FORC54_3033 [Vibrio vulnificus]
MRQTEVKWKRILNASYGVEASVYRNGMFVVQIGHSSIRELEVAPFVFWKLAKGV